VGCFASNEPHKVLYPRIGRLSERGHPTKQIQCLTLRTPSPSPKIMMATTSNTKTSIKLMPRPRPNPTAISTTPSASHTTAITQASQ